MVRYRGEVRLPPITAHSGNPMAAAITILCPKLNCKAILRVPETARGQRVRCSSCGTVFLVPQKKNGRKEPAEMTKPEATES